MAANKIEIVVDANTGALIRSMGAGSAAIGQFERTAQQGLGRVQSAFAGLSTTQKVVLGAGLGIAALGAGLAAVVGPAIQFESAFAGVRKTVDGSPKQLAAIRQGLLDMSSVMPTSARELAGIAENAGQLGVAAPQVLKFTETVAMLGETTDLDFNDAAQSLARFLNITGSGAGNIGKVADVIVELGNNSATTESQIVNFSTRLASAFTTAGASEDQILSVAAAFSSMGIQAEAGGSSLSKIITSISDAALDGGSDLQVYADTAGLLPEQFAKIAKENPVEALIQVGEGLGRMRDEGKTITPILEALALGGLRTSEIFRLLALNSDDVRASIELGAKQYAEGGAAAEEYGKRVETTAARIEILKNRLNTLAINIGTPTLGTLAAAADAAGDAIIRLAETLGPLASQVAGAFTNAAGAARQFYDVLGGPALQAALDGLTGFAAVAGGVLTVLNLMGPVGTAAAAALVLLATRATAVRTAMAGLALSIQLVGVSGTAMSVATVAAGAALAALPLALVVGSLYLIGDAFNDARATGQAFAAALSTDVNKALADLEYTKAIDGIKAMREEEARLQEQITGNTAWDVGGVRIRTWGAALDVAKGILPGFGSEVLDNEAKLKALQAALDAMDLGTYNIQVERAAALLGISTDQVYKRAQAEGVLSALITGGADEQKAAIEVIEAATKAQVEFADRTGIAREKILAGTAGMNDFSTAMGVSEGHLRTLISLQDDFKPEDFLDPDKMIAAFDAIDQMRETYEGLILVAGITTDEFDRQIAIVQALAASYNDLQSAVAGALSELDAIHAQEEATAAATVAFGEALDSVGSSTESIKTAGRAMAELVANLVASGTPVGVAINQQDQFRRALIEGAVAAGGNRAAVTELVNGYLLTEAQLVTVAAQADAYSEALRQQKRAQDDLVGRYEAEIDVVGYEEAQRKFLESERQGDQYRDKDYTATVGADGASARTETDRTAAHIQGMTNAEYMAFLEANGAAAAAESDRTGALMQGMSRARYLAFLEANGAGARAEATSTGSQMDGVVNKPRRATLTADASQAVAEAKRARDAIAAVQGKTVTIRVNRVSQIENGGIFNSAGVLSFADGGIREQYGLPAGTVLERPGPARIYPAASPGRFFSEPVTQGEAFIPMGQAKRRQAMQVWEEVGRRFGVFADGGIAERASISRGGPTLAPSYSVSVRVDASQVVGMDAQQVAALTAREVSRSLETLGRNMSNRRLVRS